MRLYLKQNKERNKKELKTNDLTSEPLPTITNYSKDTISSLEGGGCAVLAGLVLNVCVQGTLPPLPSECGTVGTQFIA